MFIIYVLSVFRWIYLRFILNKFSGYHFGLVHPTAKVKIKNKVFVSDRVTICRGASLIVDGECRFDGRVTLNDYSRVVAKQYVYFRGDVLIAQFVSILDHDHSTNKGIVSWGKYSTAPIIIGSNVWIGDKVSILKGVTIGDNVIVAANSAVTKDLSSDGIYGGVPAKKIKELI